MQLGDVKQLKTKQTRNHLGSNKLLKKQATIFGAIWIDMLKPWQREKKIPAAGQDFPFLDIDYDFYN